ncbi:MAG: 50S ribosomal protein L9 [Lachnospiraceae bacterium]|nr:50S ribosomal protein L9 [Lachnospiraceae bacterium]
MKVILLQDVKSVGKQGDIIDANDGYARNFLLPKKLAVEANSKNLNDLKLQNANKEKVAAEKLAAAKAFAEELKSQEIVLTIKAGENGKTFGSVSGKEIAAAYKDKYGAEIDKKKLLIEEPIRSFGVHNVDIKLHPQVTGTLKVKVQEK